MKPNTYQTEAVVTETYNLDAIQDRLDGPTIRLLHAGIGLSTEVGEFQDQIKKHLFYGSKLDTVNLKEELGDICWYMAIALDTLGLSFEEVFQTNINKLKQRYPNGFSQEAATNRNTQQEYEVLLK